MATRKSRGMSLAQQFSLHHQRGEDGRVFGTKQVIEALVRKGYASDPDYGRGRGGPSSGKITEAGKVAITEEVK